MLASLPAGPLATIVTFLDRPSMLKLYGTSKFVRAAIADEVQLCIRISQTALHLANVVLREYTDAYKCSEMLFLHNWKVRTTGRNPQHKMTRVFEIRSDLHRIGHSDKFAEVFADFRTHTVAASFRFHVNNPRPSYMRRKRATQLEFRLGREPMSGACTGRVLIVDEKGFHKRDDGVFQYTMINEAYAGGEVAVLRKLGVLMEK